MYTVHCTFSGKSVNLRVCYLKGVPTVMINGLKIIIVTLCVMYKCFSKDESDTKEFPHSVH